MDGVPALSYPILNWSDDQFRMGHPRCCEVQIFLNPGPRVRGTGASRRPAGAPGSKAFLAEAEDGVGSVGLFEGGDFFGRELERDRGDGVFEVVGFGGADNGGGDFGFVEKPG